jgi:hypothetical protein
MQANKQRKYTYIDIRIKVNINACSGKNRPSWEKHKILTAVQVGVGITRRSAATANIPVVVVHLPKMWVNSD